MGGESPIAAFADWPVVSLAEITNKIGSGATPRGGSETYLDSRIEYALIRSQNVFDRRFDRRGLAYITSEQAEALRGVVLQRSDVLLNITGDGVTFGRACIVPDDVRPACVNQHVSIIRVDSSKADAGYVLSFLTHPDVKPYIESFNSGGSRRAITKAHIESFRLPLPPLPEQRAIARILGALDDKIELNRRTNETLEAMARALFKSWFVDFDPVRAKAEGRAPVGMDAATAALFPSAYSGGVPKGWRTIQLGDAVEVNPPRPLPTGTVAPYLEMKNVPTVGHLVETWERREAGSGARFGNGDTLLARITPCLENGKTAFVDFMAAAEVGWGSTEFIVLRPKPPLPPYFGYLLARDEALRAHAIQSMTGTTGRQRVPAEAVARFPMVMPTPDVARAFGSLVEEPLRLAKVNHDESRTLADLRDLLLPKLLSGELRVRDAEKVVGQVA